MKRKMIWSVMFLASLLPMLLNQYGGMKGVQEISGLINLSNPIGIISVILYFFGVWASFTYETGSTLRLAGTVGIVVSEVYRFLTWHVMTITGEVSLQNSIRFAFPEFYVGFAVSVAMVIVCCLLNEKYRAN